jgi:hypothetical protein
MSTEAATASYAETAESGTSDIPGVSRPPTAPCSVVWSGGHAYVLEGDYGRVRWVGVDDRGRPLSLTPADLQRRGWSRTRA